jgi:hypothetical protein
MKLRTHILLVHRYINVKNIHGKYAPSELVWFNNEKATDIYETPSEFDLKTATNLTDQYSSVQAWNMYLFPQWCRI